MTNFEESESAMANTAGEREALRIGLILTHEQVSALYVTLFHRARPAFGWIEEPLVAIEALLKPAHDAIHDRTFNAMNRQFFGDDRMAFKEAAMPTDVATLSTAPTITIEDTDDAWDKGLLGREERFAKVADHITPINLAQGGEPPAIAGNSSKKPMGREVALKKLTSEQDRLGLYDDLLSTSVKLQDALSDYLEDPLTDDSVELGKAVEAHAVAIMNASNGVSK